MATTIDTLADYVQPRLEEPQGPGIFWSRVFELYSGVVEAMNDLMLLVGRPTQEVQVNFTLQPNTCFQTVPTGLLLISDIQGAGSPLYKISIYDLDYLQSSWGPDWEQDVDEVSRRWAPVGFNMFVVHPAVSVAQTVQLTGIAYPAQSTWPYPSTLTVPFEDQYFVALELYCSWYARLKELGGEAQEGIALFQQYLDMARRMTEIQSDRDPLLFTMGWGASQNVNPTTKR